MNKHLQVSFKLIDHNPTRRQEVWIQHPDLSAAIHASECGRGSFDQTMQVAGRLAQHLSLGDHILLELDEIHDGLPVSEIQLWDYTDEPTMVASISLEAAK